MIPYSISDLTSLLIRETDAALARASQQHSLSGFAYVFEVGQMEPCFHFAIDTGSSPSAPSTGEWTHPAGGFDGAEISDEWLSRYSLLSEYMSNDDELESRLHEVHAFFCLVMRQVRFNWSQRLANCVFTVNECNDSDEVVKATFAAINQNDSLALD